MKTYICLIFILVGLIASAQKGIEFSIGGHLTPSITYRTLRTGDEYMKWAVDQRDSLEGIAPVLNGGIFTEIGLKRKVAIITGISYKSFSFSSDVIDFETVEYPDINKVSIAYHYNYLSVPVQFRYSLLKKLKIDLYIHAGLSGNIFLMYNQKHIYFSDEEPQYAENRKGGINKNPFAMEAGGGFGIDFYIGNSWAFGINPVFDHFFMSSVDSDVKEYLYAIGLQLKVKNISARK